MLEWTLSVLFAWFYVTIMHEVWHMITLPLYGLKPIGFYPFWHWKNLMNGVWRVWRPWEFFKDPYNGQGKFYFARYRYKPSFLPVPGRLLHIAPLIGDCVRLILIIIVGLIFGFYPILAALAVASAVDTIVWLYGFFLGSPMCDGKRFRYGRR